LPVIDVTHPAFALSHTPEELDAIYEKHIVEFRNQGSVPPEARELFKSSVIGSAFIASSGAVLSAIPTYYLKVGGQNVSPSANPIDRAIIASAPATFVRQRLQDMARLLADGLKPALTAQPKVPFLFTCIAGGAASDTWNALLYLRQENPALLQDRSVAVRVLDMDPAAPAFGAQAIATLTAAGQPLADVSISWEYLPYNWSNAADLSARLAEFGAQQCVSATSSEGGLFEYGSDEEIVANLQAVHYSTGEGAIVVGSVTRDCESVRLSLAMGAMLERPTNFNLRLGKL
jgi:hypothetical protein